jgi:hypothetical protein
MFKNPFSFKGRIRRTEFGLSIIIFFVTLSFATTFGRFFSDESVYIRFFIPIVILSLWFLLAQTVKRLHDLDAPVWLLVMLFGPFVNMVLIIYLIFAEGNRYRNQYGEDPKDNTNDNHSENRNSINYNGGHNAGTNISNNQYFQRDSTQNILPPEDQSYRAGFKEKNPYSKNK